MICRFAKSIFQNKENGFCVFVYHTEDGTVPAAARDGYYKGADIAFTAVGKYLPDTDSVEVDMQGKWVKGKRGLQLQVENFEEILPQTEEGILGYLSSGMVKGIGPRTAELIVKRFGKRTFDVLDHYPDSLLEIRGISQKKLDAILLSYHGGHAMRDLAAYLTPFKVTPRKIEKIYEHFGADALETVKNRPFELCEISGFGFLTVDEIAKANKCRPNDPMRIEGCIHYCFEQETQDGHLYVNKQQFQKAVHEQLNYGYSGEVVTEREVYNGIYKLFSQKELYYEDGALYPAKFYGFECGAAKRLVSLLMEKETGNIQVDLLLEEAQRELGILLSAKQSEAVKKAFSHKVSIITGGPGTGKTTVQKVLLYINEKIGGGTVLLTAPTGRASRRMVESTGFSEGFTMHSVLGLTNDEENEGSAEMLDADFIIADEFSMADMALSFQFFNHIRQGARLVLVGDVNQLPSVGPGNVFRELVQCGVIPVTVLDMVFRQKENSRIAMNAQRMQQNDASLDYGTDFVFREAKDAAEAAEMIQKIYQEAVERLGVEKVQVLSPYRKKGEVSVNALNEVLWNMVNPEPEPEAGLTNDEENEGSAEMLDADFIIADEFSMADMALSFQFFNHIRQGARLVLVGDVNQLPSVGPGNVFRELVQCGVIPVTVLDMVFRQKENSRIAMNAQRMQQNDASLDYGTDFVFREAKDAAEAAEMIQKIYQEAVERLGVEKVQVLSPYRKKGEVSVNALNEVLWNMVNPEPEPEAGQDTALKKKEKNVFRIGDRIIHNRNKNGISNGDIGFVTDIFTDEDDMELTRLEFSDGRHVEYNSDELDMVEHSYATTVHKSQGSEYPVVILPWLPMFYKMLRRNILYTAVTRAKEQVVIVGSKKAIYMAIHNTDSDKRNTRLGERVIREFYAAQEREKKEAV